MYSDVVYGSLRADEIIINEREFERRIGGKGLFYNDEVQKCLEKLKKAISYKYSFVEVDVEVLSKGICRLEFNEIESKDLCKNLKGCNKAYLMAVTVGTGVDRLLSRLRVSSPGEYLITDALSSSAAEGICDYTDELIKQNSLEKGIWKPRYSPGYGDCSIENQKFLLGRLNADKKMGIMLNESCFMTPSKSITAIMGMKYE